MRLREMMIGLALVACSKSSAGTAPTATTTASSTSTAVATSSSTSIATTTSTSTSVASSASVVDSGRAPLTLRVGEGEALEITQAIGVSQPAHPFFRGDFGPAGDVVFGVTQGGTMSGYIAVAATPEKKSWKALPVDSLTDTNWSGWEIDAVMFRDVDGSGHLSPIVIAEYMTGIGPTGAQPFVFVSVFTWNGKKFARNLATEKALDGAKDAAEIDRRLAALKKRE